jgi:Fe2+ transport system protein FeoA
MKSIAETKPGFLGTIAGLQGDTRLVERLAELGLAPGNAIHVTGVVAFGEPLLVEVKGTHIALRRSEARCILVS